MHFAQIVIKLYSNQCRPGFRIQNRKPNGIQALPLSWILVFVREGPKETRKDLCSWSDGANAGRIVKRYVSLVCLVVPVLRTFVWFWFRLSLSWGLEKLSDFCCRRRLDFCFFGGAWTGLSCLERYCLAFATCLARFTSLTNVNRDEFEFQISYTTIVRGLVWLFRFVWWMGCWYDHIFWEGILSRPYT